jgi:hypothetical protein
VIDSPTRLDAARWMTASLWYSVSEAASIRTIGEIAL